MKRKNEKRKEPKELTTFRLRPWFKDLIRIEAKALRMSQDELLERSYILYSKASADMSEAEHVELLRKASEWKRSRGLEP